MPIKINGQTIPQSAVDFELGRLIQFYSKHMSESEVRNQLPELQQKARDQAIGAKLLLEQASKMDLRVSEEEVNAQLEEMTKKLGGEAALKAQLDKQNMSVDAVRLGIIQGRKVELLVAKLSEGLADPSDEEIREHYDTHPEEYTRPDRAAAQHILIKAEADSEASKATTKSRLEALRTDIQQGGSFETLAGAHSECSSGKSAGGSLGWFAQGMMVPEFDQVVFPMRVGELSPVVETTLGFHLIRKTGHEDGGKLSFEEVTENIREFLRHSTRGALITQHVNELKEKHTIEITED